MKKIMWRIASQSKWDQIFINQNQGNVFRGGVKIKMRKKSQTNVTNIGTEEASFKACFF